MNWNDCEVIWKRQPAPQGADAKLADLRDTFETKRRRMALTLKLRDYGEGAAGLLVATVFAWTGWHLGRDGWPVWLAVVVMLGLSGAFVRERLRAHRLRLGPEAPLLAKVEADLAELNHQRRLLLNIGSWYLMPCGVAIVLFGYGTIRKGLVALPPDAIPKLAEHPVVVVAVVGYVGVLLPVLFWAIWAVNRRTVRRNIEPRIAELEKLHRDLVAPVES